MPQPSLSNGFPGCFGAPGGDIEGGKQGYKDKAEDLTRPGPLARRIVCRTDVTRVFLYRAN